MLLILLQYFWFYLEITSKWTTINWDSDVKITEKEPYWYASGFMYGVQCCNTDYQRYTPKLTDTAILKDCFVDDMEIFAFRVYWY